MTAVQRRILGHPVHLEVKFQHFHTLIKAGKSLQRHMSLPQMYLFNVGHIVEYFVTRTVCDNLPAADFKSVNRLQETCFAVAM